MGHYLYQVYITLGLAFFIILAGNNALLYASQNQFKTVGYDITSLRQLCPRADICTQGQGGSQKDSCCLTCSCDSNCKKIGNCCDGNEAIGNMCHLPLVERENLDTYGEPMYFMIDTCLNDSVYIECLVEDVAPWGWLYPVYDPVSDLNFYNHRCAECNGVQDYIYWDLKLKSSFDDRSLSHCLSAMAGDPLKDCTLGFTPPKEMEVIDHVCSIEIIHTCNVSGLWAMYDAELEHACHRWYSPVIDYISGELRYANVYCGMCNGETIAPTDVCPDTVWDRTTGIAHTDSLSMILDYKKVQKVIENQPTMKTGNAKNGLCDQYMVKHPTKVIHYQRF